MSRNAEELVREILHERPKYRGLDCNTIMVIAEARVTDESARSSPISTSARVRRTIEKIEQKLAVSPAYTEGRQKFWQAHPELVRVIACDNFLDYRCEEEGDASFDTLEYIFGQPGSREFFPVNQQYQAEQARASAEVVEAVALRTELLNRFKDVDGRLHKTVLPQQFKKEEQRVLNLDLVALRQEVADVREKKRLASLSPADLRAEIHRDALKRQQSAYVERWPKLPETWFPRGSYTGIPLNRETLLQMAKNDVELFRRFVTNYGQQQIDARLNGQS
jgi:hypothetical protein